MLVFSNDKDRLLRHFSINKVLFAYHIGDLDDFYFPHCQWAVSYHHERARIEETILTYSGGDVPSVLAFGLTDNFNKLLDDLIDLLPDKFYSHFFENSRDVFLKRYKEEQLGTFSKMKLEKFMLASDNSGFDIVRLDESHTESLKNFYKSSYPENYFTSRMIESKMYFGALDKNEIISVSGVHVYSEEYKIAVLGNIATAESHRGKGIATAVTSHLLKELKDKVNLICLNVKSDNQPAIKCYENIGFKKQLEYQESFFELDASKAIAPDEIEKSLQDEDDSLRNYGDRT